MMSNIEWPLGEQDRINTHSPTIGSLSHRDACCPMSLADIENHWNNRLLENLVHWDDSDDFTEGHDVGTELIASYDKEGYDAYVSTLI